MLYKLLTDVVIFIHLAFILFVVLGGLMVIRWRIIVWVHIPAIIWGIIIEYYNILCPLTPLENYFREMAGAETYNVGFIDQYITPIIYPSGFNRNMQIVFGTLVILINAFVYMLIFIRIRRQKICE